MTRFRIVDSWSDGMTRNCPWCGLQLSYSSPFNLRKAERKGSLCRSCTVRNRSGRRAWTHSRGYIMWGNSYVHRIVCVAWHGLPPTAGHEVNHIDGDKTNNHPENLEWVTHAENVRHARDLGLSLDPPLHRGERQHNSRLTRRQVVEMRRLSADGVSFPELARRFGVKRRTAYGVATGRSWRHVPMPDPAS